MVDLKAEYEMLKTQIQQEINDVLESSSFILGEKVKEIEAAIAAYSDTSYAIGVGNGTDALLLALEGLGIGKGDEVITTAFTFFATAEVIARIGAVPVFIDIDPKTCNINPNLLEKAITKTTKAIIVVHLFGQPTDMDPILKVAKKHDLKIIEDACQSIGATYKKKKVGSLGDVGCFSFFPSKNLGAFGDGGMVVTNNKNLYEKIKLLRNHGSLQKYIHQQIGLNSRLDEIQAAILKVKFEMLDDWTDKRREVAKRYSDHLKEFVDIPAPEENRVHVYHQYCIQTKKRDALSSFLNKKQIATAVYYPIPLHLQKAFKYLGYKEKQIPIAERVSKNILAIPIYPLMTKDIQDYIIFSIKEYLS
ncbi:DegT/DnrJ/EryC1/StrS aminotransferase family protein [Alteribacillus sp. YIM 98480]|uniref:DegT/DnrJ/EryC1/StrS family aminotransferase n=1 Tax=Alteribacillus sp. YIM 98480 TaxID=2606599 RepID=UPI0018EEE08E|nr:DegT/DnrJ/EryC1/StrS family aminotransferase [Alteribacillus sp. YIM 98480]